MTTIKVHVFYDSGEAYDASQCSDEIKDGDVLFALEDGVAAVLFKAYPVTPKSGYRTDVDGAFDTPKNGSTIHDVAEDMRSAEDGVGFYSTAIAVAEAICHA